MADNLNVELSLLGLPAFTSGLRAAGGELSGFGGQLSQTDRLLTRGAIGLGITAGLLGFLGHAAVAAGEDTARFQRALGGFESHGNPFPLAELQQFTGELEARLGIADDEIAQTVGILGTFGITPQQAKRLTEPLLDATESLKALGFNAEHVANQVGKALETGNVTSLRRVGIVVSEEDVARVGAFNAVLAALERQGAGAAEKFRSTFPGAMQAARTSFGEFTEEIGRGLTGPLGVLANVFTGLVNGLKAIPGAGTAVAVALGAATVVMAAYTFQTLAAARALLLFNAQQAGIVVRSPLGALGGLLSSPFAAPALAGLGIGVGGFAATQALISGNGPGDILGRALGSAASGAAAGAFVGGVPGAIVGGIIGLTADAFGELIRQGTAQGTRDGNAQSAQDAQLAELQQQNATLKAAYDELVQIRQGGFQVEAGSPTAHAALAPGRVVAALAGHLK